MITHDIIASIMRKNDNDGMCESMGIVFVGNKLFIQLLYHGQMI